MWQKIQKTTKKLETPQEVTVDEDVHHLVDNIYPQGKKELLKGEKFLKTLKAVAYSYQ